MTEIKVPDAGGATINMVDVGGFIQAIFFKSGPEIQNIFDNVLNYKFRNDDLMLCTFSKTGTNWMYEILMMILNRSAQRIKTSKLLTMLECVTAEEADQQQSPRVINCHYPPRFLPLADIKVKQIKTVLCLRNPKDTAVSSYNHTKGIKMYGYDRQWEDWFPVYLEGKYSSVNTVSINCSLCVSDITNGEEELDKLLTFLDIQLDEQLKCYIMDMCSFMKMAEDKGKNNTTYNQDFKFYRKGQVGDWKNWFTVAQNEIFDKIWENETKDLDMFKFKYTQNNA